MDGKKYLDEFYLKTLLINGSASTVNTHWGENTLLKIERHVFTDPLNVDIVNDMEQVAHFNNLFGINEKTIKWRKVIDSKQTIMIDVDNKEAVIKGFITQNYLMLSISLFENLITFFKMLLHISFGEDVYKGNSAKSIINIFQERFKVQINLLDEKTINKIPFISTIHNLRMFRNCIVHHNSEIKEIEREFIKDKDRLMLQRCLFFYKINNGKLTLDLNDFKQLSDLYSQLAYIGYMCHKETT